MIDNLCKDIRNQAMYFIDNELPENKRQLLVEHLSKCVSCQDYLNEEKEIKSKICKKLKASYACKCDIQRLAEAIKCKIGEILKQ